MKSKSVLIVLLMFFFTMGCFAESKNGFSIGIGSGVPFYGSESVRNTNSDMNGDNFSRMIINLNAGYYIKLTDYAFFTLGCDSITDFHWYGSQYCNYFDYAFFGGMKIYPGIGGFGFSVDYAFGRRTDFMKLNNEDDYIHNTAWGNGFIFGIEYDFRYGTDGWAPILGIDWRRMPRGNSETDNVLSVSCKFPFP